jgi:hypothetical protein
LNEVHLVLEATCIQYQQGLKDLLPASGGYARALGQEHHLLAARGLRLLATRAELERRAARPWAALADGSLRVPPVERHSLAGAAEAHSRLERRSTSGALVLLA